MAALTYQTLIGAREQADSIKNWLNNTAVPAEAILRDAQLWIYKRLRVREMTVRDEALTLTSGEEKILFSALSETYRGPRHLMFTGIEKSIPSRKLLDFVLSQRNWDAQGARVTGRPRYWSTTADEILFENVSDKNYTVSFTYYADKPELGPDATKQTNFLTAKYSWVLRYAILMFGNEWKEDERRKIYYLKAAEQAITDANTDSDMELEGVELDMIIDGGGAEDLQGFGNL